MSRVLITRPKEDAGRTAAAIEAMGHHVLIAPLFETRALPAQWLSSPDAVVVTSANALRACSATDMSRLRHLPVFTVGDATAKAASEAGFSHVLSAKGNAEALAAMIMEKQRPCSRLLQLAGRPRQDAAIKALAGNYSLETIETYETVACETLPDAIRDALRSRMINIALHFSARAAQVLMDLAESTGLEEELQAIRHIAISKAAIDRRYNTMECAEQPTLDAMLRTLSRS